MTMKRKTGPAVIKGPPGETPLGPNPGDSRSEYWRYSANLNEDILQQSKTQHKQTRMVCAIVSEMCGARGRTGCPSEHHNYKLVRVANEWVYGSTWPKVMTPRSSLEPANLYDL